MSSLSGTRSATRGDLLDLQQEQKLVLEGYEFLDEKRIQLAAELLRELQRYEQSYAAYAELHGRAIDSLKAAIHEHGLDELSIYPVEDADTEDIQLDGRRFLGVELIVATARFDGGALHDSAILSSPEARRCGSIFHELLGLAVALGALYANLQRLSVEYQRTDRRARALENVLLPQIGAEIKAIAEQLELIEQEDAIRVRVI